VRTGRLPTDDEPAVVVGCTVRNPDAICSLRTIPTRKTTMEQILNLIILLVTYCSVDVLGIDQVVGIQDIIEKSNIIIIIIIIMDVVDCCVLFSPLKIRCGSSIHSIGLKSPISKHTVKNDDNIYIITIIAAGSYNNGSSSNNNIRTTPNTQ
jgi:hypothetical protein